jgi:hypothetical protein
MSGIVPDRDAEQCFPRPTQALWIAGTPAVSYVDIDRRIFPIQPCEPRRLHITVSSTKCSYGELPITRFR